MRFEGIQKVHDGKFISRYDLTYETEDHKTKVYEIISRNQNLQSVQDVQNPHTDGVVIIVTNPGGDKILLNKEYRMSVAGCVYNFPAGLIDAGEDAKEAAARELKEETGLDLLEVKDQMFDSYSAIGFSNETNAVIVGVADGTFAPSTSTVEEIEAAWYSKEEVLELLKKYHFAARTQAYCYLWARQS